MGQGLATGTTPWISEEKSEAGLTLQAGGAWIVGHSPSLYQTLEALKPRGEAPIIVDLSRIERLDTAGAWLLYRTVRDLRAQGLDVEYTGGTEQQRALIEQASLNDALCLIEPPQPNVLIRVLEDVGAGVVRVGAQVQASLGFVGLVLEALWRSILNPRRFRLTATVRQMELVGLNALPIVGLISFLIGIVIAYQGAYQLRFFGAEIFTVNLVVTAVLREFGILLSAIIIAGRSGSAFTAEIGSMKMHQEIDAMDTLAISPLDTLVVPRVVALIVMMPILTFYSDIVGLLGGAVISWLTLDITPQQFLERTHDVILGWDLGVGLIKAPIFGAIIALIGCYEGLSVEGSAESVGQRTTKSVVESIFMIIVLDAFFAVFFTSLGI
ncbi:MlaE family lipid ABC transporter permease subunit [Iodidimonas sp. SYSU 1G8]|uniref:ABC transporter permease n=1 Tax=Iodidimonas sp. SYSU 1G8 TaxID=3133967 RepID=UPI0031FEF350